MDAGDGKVARNGGYLGSGRSMASGGRFLREPSWYSRGGVLCVERRCSRIGSCGRLASANVLEDRGDDIGIFDAGDDAQFTAAFGAGLDVDGEDAFQAPHPGHGGKGLIRLFVARFAFWHDGLTMLAIRREHAVEPGEVQSRTRDQRRQAGDEVEWLEDDAGGAVAKRLLEPIDDLSPIIGREPLVGDGGPCDVATELFELVALGGFTDGGGGAKSPAAWRARWMGRVRAVPGWCARSMPSCRRWTRWRSGSG